MRDKNNKNKTRSKINSTEEQSAIRDENDNKEKSKPIKAQVLSPLESMNVEIPQNRDAIRDEYLKKMMVVKEDFGSQAKDYDNEDSKNEGKPL